MVLPNHSSIYKITSGCPSKTATVAFENRHKIYASQEMDSFALNSDFNFDWKCPTLDNYFLYNNPIPEHVVTNLHTLVVHLSIQPPSDWKGKHTYM